MEYMETLFCGPFATQLNFGQCQNIQNNMDFDRLNFTASDDDDYDDEFGQALTQVYQPGLGHTRITGEQTQPLFHPNQGQQHHQSQVREKATSERPIHEKILSKTPSDSNGNKVKRKRGPNKNQKVLTEEERKRKKAKALCRNAESARTCRGKRKQAEEKLKMKSANVEREFHILCQTRGELGQELFDLLKQARSIKDPLLIEAVDQAAIRLSSLMTHSRMMQELLDLRLQQMPLEPLLASRRSSSSSALQKTPDLMTSIAEAYLPPTAFDSSASSSVIQQQKNTGSNPDIDGYNGQHKIVRESFRSSSRSSTHPQLDMSTSRRGSTANASSPQNDPGISSSGFGTPTSIRKMSLAQEDELLVMKHQLSASPNPFMGGDTTPHEDFENTLLMEILPTTESSSFLTQHNLEQKTFGYIFSPSPIPHYNDPPSTFDSNLFTQLTPPSLNTPNFNQQTYDFSFSQPPPPPSQSNQPTPSLPATDEGACSDLDSAIAQLTNFA